MLAVGLLLLVLGSFYFLAVAPLVELYQQRQARIEDGRMLLPRLHAVAAGLPALRARVAELRAAARTRKVTLEGASDAIASASLQSRIEGFATSVGATIGSTESLPADTLDGYRRIGLRFALNGTYETLVRLLAELEEATPPLVVDNLQVHGVLRRPGLPQSGVADLGLDAGIDVYGFRNDDKAAAAAPQ
ncbi:MAG TPA: type II secretion system protein GspM [Stellaceae bacterium]|jgi:general secretion pathway protein M|nr:type II secretion system protein GspM [Stellaceae bacterium]